MKIRISSKLMPNHVAGVPLAAQRSVAVAYAGDRSALLFSLDEANTFAVTLPSADSGTGWEQVDLGAQLAGLNGLGPQPVVQSFAMAQDNSGTIWMVVAAAAAPSAPSAVFITAGLSNESTAADWHGFAGHVSARTIPAGYVVSQAVVGSTGGDYPLAVLVAHDAAGAMHHLQLNPDPGPGDWQSLPLQFPANTTRCRAVAVGMNGRYGPGVYAVCELATLLNLTFTTLPQVINGRPVVQTVQLALPDGLNPYAIAPVADASGNTELYAGGQGLYRWPVAAQTHSNQPGQPVAGPDTFAGVTEVVVAADEPTGVISVWGQDERDVLMQITGMRLADDSITWQPALPVAPEVTAVAAYRVSDGGAAGTAGLVLGMSDGGLHLAVQNAQTSLWERQTVAVQQPAVAQTLNTYTTRIVVIGDDGTPWRNCTVEVRPDMDRAVLINGAYYALRKSVAKPAQTDINGVLTIVAETSDLTTPAYTVTAAAETLIEDPGAEAKGILRTIETGTDLADAKRCNGQKLFPTPPDPGKAEAAATAISQAMKVHDALAAGRSAGRGNAGPRSREHPSTLVAISVHDGHADLLRGMQAALPDGADWFTVTPGDLLRALFQEDTFTFWIDSDWNFCVQIGPYSYRFSLDLPEKAIAVIDWVLRKTLGLSLDDLVSWLGFIFSWEDIRTNHRVIAAMVDMYLGWMATSLAALKTDVSTVFASVIAQIEGGGIHPDMSDPAFNDQAGQAPDNQSDAVSSPEENWGSQQMTANAGGAKPESSALPDFTDLWTNLSEAEVEVLQQAYAQLREDVLDNYQQYTIAQLIEKFLSIVAVTVARAVEETLLTVLEASAMMASVIRALLTQRWEIPVLTYVYEEIICGGDGSKLTLLDLLSLLVAIPATIGAKLLTQQNLFSPQQIDAVLNAGDWDAMIEGLRATALRSGTMPGDKAPGDNLVTAAVLEFIGMISRGASAIFFALRELSNYSSFSKAVFNIAKIAADLLTYTMAAVSLFVIGVSSNAPRAVIDRLITLVSIGAPARDAYLVYYRWKYGDDCPATNLFRIVETACGLAIAICAAVSLGLQVKEPPPKNIDPAVWDTILALKFIQNFCSGAYYFLAFTAIFPNWRTQGALLRFLILGVRLVANLTRSSMQLAVRVADYDGPL